MSAKIVNSSSFVTIILLFLLCTKTAFADCNVTAGCSESCPNIASYFVVYHDSVLNPDTRYHRFRVLVDAQGFDAAVGGGMYAIVTCVGGGNGLGKSIQCYDFVTGDTGCVDCSIDSTLDVAWCQSVVAFELRILSKNHHGTDVVCRCRDTAYASPPFFLPEQANAGTPSCSKVGDPVNAVNGNLSLDRTDAVIGGDRGLPIALTFYYNGYRPETNPDATLMWTNSYDIRLHQAYVAHWGSEYFVGPITLAEGNGRTTVFQPTGTFPDLSFTGKETSYLLLFNDSTYEYTIRTPDDLVYHFNQYDTLSYRVHQIVDPNGNSLTIQWSSEGIQGIVAGDSARSAHFQYTQVGGKWVVSSLHDINGDTLATYTYHPSIPFLTKVTYPDGSWVEYTRGPSGSALGRIIKTTTSDSATWHWQYNAAHQVSAEYNNVSPDVQHSGINYNSYEEFHVDTIVDGVDTTFDTVVTGIIYETDVTQNHDTSHVVTFTARKHSAGYRRILTSVTEGSCGGCGKEFYYDFQGNITSVEYANGRTDVMRRDDRGNIDTLIVGSGETQVDTTALTYHADYNLPTTVRTASVAKPGDYRLVSMTHDSSGNVTQVVETGWLDTATAYADTTTMEYNEFGQLLKIDGPRNDVADTIAFRYDTTLGDLQYILLANGDTVTYGPRPVGVGGPPYVIDPNGVRTEFTYDGRGRLVSILENAPTDDSARTTVDLNFKGAVSQLTLPMGQTYSFSRNSSDWLTSMTTADGDSAAYGYDQMSNLASLRYYDSAQQMTLLDSFAYDWKSQLTRHDAFEYRHDEMGQPDTIIVDAENDSTFLEYDIFGRLTKVIEVADDGSHVTTEFSYDVRGNLTEVLDPDSNLYMFWYDDRGQITRDSNSVTGVTAYSYDAAGNLTSRTDANNTTVSFTYDALGRVTVIDYPDSLLDVSFAYDSTIANGRGRLAREKRIGSAIDYAYDASGRVIEERHTLADTTYSIGYAYNLNGQVTSVTYPSGVEYSYGYDSEGRIEGIAAQLGEGQVQVVVDSIRYLPFGGIKSIRYANGITTRYAYDSSYTMTGITTGLDSILNRSYVYDTLGNILSYYDSLNTNHSTTYTYDKLGRQLTMVRPSLPEDAVAFAYFDNDNRWLRIVGTDTTEYSYANNRLSSISGAETADFGYDDNGNMIWQAEGADTVSFGYDLLNHLTSVTVHDTTYEHEYNVRHQRQMFSGPGGETRFLHARTGLMLTEYDSTDWTADFVYLYGIPIARVWAENVIVDTTTVTNFDISWYHLDHLGTPQALTDSAKTVRWSAKYYPFGELASEDVSTVNNLRFPGQYDDRSTNTYYNMYRHYHPGLGRYLTPDPIGLAGGMNLYAYAGQNPVLFFDPYGLYTWGDFGHDVAHFLIGFGDEMSFGITKWIRSREFYGGDYYTNECAISYQLGEWAGVAVSSLTGTASGVKVATKQFARVAKYGAINLGLEFSHWIPKRYLKRTLLKRMLKKSIWSGSYVSSELHSMTDIYRLLGRQRKYAKPMYSLITRQWIRLPMPLKGFVLGTGYGMFGYASNNYVGYLLNDEL